MNTNLTRVQVYLDPHDIVEMDRLAKKKNVSRSQIIRDAVSIVTRQYTSYIKRNKSTKREKNPLLEMAGFEKSKTGTLGLNVDEIYEHV